MGVKQTFINAELRDARRTLPRVLVVGTNALVVIYIRYYLGISGILSTAGGYTAGLHENLYTL